MGAQRENRCYGSQERQGGINWYYYCKKILGPKLLPWAKKLIGKRPKTIVQEDNAGAYASYWQEEVFITWEVHKLLWPGNSPDLNAIEPCWMWIKRETTKKGAINNIKDLKAAQEQCWQELLQEKIQAWIKRIPVHIKEVIRLKGGKMYTEGMLKGKEKRRVHD